MQDTNQNNIQNTQEQTNNIYQAAGKVLEGKTGIIMGVANKDSIAWHIAMIAKANGAKVYVTHQAGLTKWAQPLCQSMDIEAFPCEVTDDESIKTCMKEITAKSPKIDFVVYGPAFANKDELKGNYLNMNRANFAQAMDISCYSLIPVLNALKAHLPEQASILALTYHGSQKVIPCYDLMGIAKAALEANIRYLAYYLGGKLIRVNGLSAGPVRTLAASRGIKGYDCLEEYYSKNSPLERNITVEEAAKSALYLLSDLSSGVTGEIHYVDTGYNIMGVKNPNTDDVDLSSYRQS